MLIHRIAGGLHHKHVDAADILEKLEVNFSIGKTLQLHLPYRDADMPSYVLGEPRIRRAGKQLETFVFAELSGFFAFGLRRLLGLRLSPLRAWIGGLIALACASPIITAIGSSIAKHNGSWSFLPAVWFVILGARGAVVAGRVATRWAAR